MIRFLLFPFSLLFGIITFVRNRLYDWKCMPSVQYDDIYVISVGNITVGGTGKTPFVEYLVRAISQNYRVAVLSRGYKRSTKGFRFADGNVTAGEVGDEPYQIKRKFHDIVVAVDADRVRGIAQIRKTYPDTQVILLDDAFQYRRIKPNLSILLADYSRPLYRDSMLPGGRLREWACFAQRADVMAVTKSPSGIASEERKDIERRYARIFSRELFFTTIRYGEPQLVFPAGEIPPDLKKPTEMRLLATIELNQYDVLLVTGIANPKPFEDYIRQYAASVLTINFPDHHSFSEKDTAQITEKWKTILSANKLLLTTEKDAARLQQVKIPEIIAKYSYFVPIEVDFIDEGKKRFEQKSSIIFPIKNPLNISDEGGPTYIRL